MNIFLQVFRHGERNPGNTFPTDLYGMSLYPEGPDQLTKLGIQQTYQYGRYLRQQYAGYLSSQWNKNESFAQSSNAERALQSGLMVLAGLYPPIGDEIWNTNITWYPVPLHAWDDHEDPVLILCLFKRVFSTGTTYLVQFVFCTPMEASRAHASQSRRPKVLYFGFGLGPR